MSEVLNGKPKQLEKVAYMGELRIIGQIVENIQSKELLGYLIMTEKTHQMKPYTTEQTKWLIQKFKFVNAELNSTGQIINTECAMDKLPKFNKNIVLLENNKAIILGKIFKNDKADGFRVLSPKGIITDISEKELFTLLDKGITFVNVKVVNKDSGKPYISAIKKEFTRIEKSEVSNDEEIEILSSSARYRRARKVEKIIDASERVLKNLFTSYKLNGAVYLLKTNATRFGNADRKKVIEILVKEIIDDKNMALKIMKAYTNKELHFLEDIHIDCNENIARFNNKDVVADTTIFLLMQLVVDESKIDNIREHLPYMLSYSYNRVQLKASIEYMHKSYKVLVEKGLITPRFQLIFDEALKHAEDTYNLRYKKVKRINSKKELVELRFRSAETINNMGLSIADVSKRGTIIDKTYIRYLVDYIPNYSEYKKMSQCLGDLMLIARIEAVLKYYTKNANCDKYWRYSDLSCEPLCNIQYGDLCDNKKYTYELDEEMKSRISEEKETTLGIAEMLLAVLAIYRPDIAEKYLKHLKKYIPEAYNMLPGFDFNKSTNYELSDYCATYYRSGMCVLQVNEEGKTYNLRHCVNQAKKAEGSAGYLAIKNELATVVLMITSDLCNEDIVNKYIIGVSQL